MPRTILAAVLVSMLLTGTTLAATEIQRVILHSDVLDEDRPLNIAFPDGYSADNTYPVVYALDGGAGYLPGVAEEMLSANGEMIIVGVENIDRNRDMFPDPVPAKNNQGGGGAKFLEFLTAELIPYIDAKYSTTDYRVLSGQSNSGFFTLYAMITAPEAYAAYLAISPMIGWDWDLIREGTTKLFAEDAAISKSLFMNRGEPDFNHVWEYLPGYVELLEELAPAGFRWSYVVVKDGDHVPAGSFRDGIAFVFEGR